MFQDFFSYLGFHNVAINVVVTLDGGFIFCHCSLPKITQLLCTTTMQYNKCNIIHHNAIQCNAAQYNSM